MNDNMRKEFEAWWSSNMNIQEMDLYCGGPPQAYYICHETQRGWLAWQASAAHSAERIAELEGQVAMLRERASTLVDALNKTAKAQAEADNAVENYSNPNDYIERHMHALVAESEAQRNLANAISATAQTAEQYRRRVQAEALEEAKRQFCQIPNSGVFLICILDKMIQELRNPPEKTEWKGKK